MKVFQRTNDYEGQSNPVSLSHSGKKPLCLNRKCCEMSPDIQVAVQWTLWEKKEEPTA